MWSLVNSLNFYDRHSFDKQKDLYKDRNHTYANSWIDKAIFHCSISFLYEISTPLYRLRGIIIHILSDRYIKLFLLIILFQLKKLNSYRRWETYWHPIHSRNDLDCKMDSTFKHHELFLISRTLNVILYCSL